MKKANNKMKIMKAMVHQKSRLYLLLQSAEKKSSNSEAKACCHGSGGYRMAKYLVCVINMLRVYGQKACLSECDKKCQMFCKKTYGNV